MVGSAIVENAPIGIFVVDKDDNFIVFNKSMESISGLSANDVMELNLFRDSPLRILDGKSGFDQLFQNAKHSLKNTYREKMSFIKPAGDIRYHTLSFIPSVDDNGAYDGMTVYMEGSSDGLLKEESVLHELQQARQMGSLYRDIPVIFFKWFAKEGWPIEFVSDNISQFGYNKDDFISGSIPFADIVHPDDYERVRDQNKKVEDGKLRYLFDEYRILNSEGNSVWVNELSILRRDSAGYPSYYEGMIIDVTDRVKAESSLARERDYLNDVTSSLDIGLAIISQDYRTMWANDYQKKVFGDVEGKHCYMTYNKKTGICENCPVQKILETGKKKVVADQSSYDVKGNPVWSHLIASPIYDDYGNIESVMELVFPITDMKLVEMELRENKARLESILKATPVGMGIVSNRVFEEVNARFCEMLGYSGEELIGKSPRMIYSDYDTYKKVSDELGSMIVKQGMGELEAQMLCKDGTVIDVIVSSSPIYPDFISRGLTFTVMDITELKNAERELIGYATELERLNELKDLFSDIIRHDLLNPAGLVTSYAEVLENEEENEYKLQVLNKLKQNNSRVIELIENASKYEKLNSVDEIDYYDMDLVAICKVVIDSLNPLIRKKGMDLIVSSEGPCFSNVNPFVSEVFFNLISNAIKYGDGGKRIDVEFLDTGKYWEVRITDRGEGISDEYKKLVFDRFRRVDKKGVKGTGLGLAIVKRIMELHDGDYGVEDNPEGKGSVFRVAFKKVDK